MSISQDSGAVIVCREVFDEASHPSNEEVNDYARQLGIDPDTEPHLLDLAREGLMAPLPKGWTPYLSTPTGQCYYYHASTKTTTWEHPLDARNRELVERARAGLAARQLSLDDDSKTTAKELESHEEAMILSKEIPPPSKLPISVTKIPTKLAPLRKPGPGPGLEPIFRRKGSAGSADRLDRRSTADFSKSDRSDVASSLMTDRAARDYTNLIFRDPKFYETPRLLDSPERELKLSEIVKRSESMSPRYEKDWEQLSGKFSSEENVIDIDKLSVSSLTRSEVRVRETPDKFDKEKHPRNIGQQKELTLSGGGSVFLKSNRSRDSTPCQEAARLDDFHLALESTMGPSNEIAGNALGERPKSILREKFAEDEERPLDEERKSVRFDLEKDPEDIKFTFSSFDDDDDDGEDDEDDDEDDGDNSESDSEGAENFGSKKRESFYTTLQKSESRFTGQSSIGFQSTIPSYDSNIDGKSESGSEWKEKDPEGSVANENVCKDEDAGGTTPPRDLDSERKTNSKLEVSDKDFDGTNEPDRVERTTKNSKIIGRRFLVENVSEKEHLSQLSKDDSVDYDTEHLPKNKFGNVKNIDLFSKSETESSNGGRSGSIRDDTKGMVPDADSLDEIRKSKEIMLENMKRTDQRVKRERQRQEREQDYKVAKFRDDLEEVDQVDRGRTSRSSLDDIKTVMTNEHDKELKSLKQELDAKLQRSKIEMETKFAEEKLELERDLERRLCELRIELESKKKEETKKLVAQMDELRMENLNKVRNELEICYEKERQDILENLKTELDRRRCELLELRNQEMDKLRTEHEKNLAESKTVKLAEFELTKQQTEKIEAMKRGLEKEFDDLRNDLRTQQREKVTKITEDHDKCLAEILRDFRLDEAIARKLYKQRLEEIRSDFSRDTDKEVKKQAERVSRQETVDFEKIRCEKHLLEDKYKTLKDKYSKLKNDVRLAVERRSKRREANATASETEKSTSARTRTERSAADTSIDQKASATNTRSNSIANSGFGRTRPMPGESSVNNQNEAEGATAIAANGEDDAEEGGLQRPQPAGFLKSIPGVGSMVATADSSRSWAKFESDDTTTASETVNSNILKNKRKSFAKRSSSSAKQSQNNNNVNGSDNPVENIRKQLEKLEDLGDQLPSNESAYTLRYPFQDKAPANASSELEFFRHRIHVERDSVKRAREALRVQRSAFQSRQRAWKQRSARATLEQLVQEERELSDMEVSLHRTRSLLGEKVIYLRHLEQSLEKVASAKRNESESAQPSKNADEITLSDMSSASSGFSSTDLGTYCTFIDKPDHYQESTEIIASLENLNSEIREIWGVLNKRQDNNIPPPPTLMYSDLGWLPFQHLTTQSNNVQGFGTPNIQSNILSQLTAAHPPITTTQNIIAQYGPNSGFTTSVGTVERGASSLIEKTRHMKDWLRQARIESTDLIGPGQATL